MKSYKTLLLLSFFCGSFLSGCYEDMDDVVRKATTLEINSFIWRGMNNTYLYKADVPELADDAFEDKAEFKDCLDNFASPESLFAAIKAPQDRFSFLVDDYVELENALEGIAVTHGMEYGLIRYSGASSPVLGYVRYVLPNTSASRKGIERGHLFTTVDGQQLTLENYSRLLAPPQYTIGLATIENSKIIPTGETVQLTKEEYTENPVYFYDIFETSNGKTGYLMYNSFTGSFDAALNNVFGVFKNEGITNLILDLRYNGGGSVETAADLGSMITGQFEGEVFSTEQWNADYQAYLEENDPERLLNLFNNKIRTGQNINSLGFSKIYIITTLRTASASELVINSLEPYIEVVQIGERTTGKFQASVTLYDSPDFSRKGANPDHTYAIQPLIYKSANAEGTTDYLEGLTPDVQIEEDLTNLGIIGDFNEPLLNVAINLIEGKSFKMKKPTEEYEVIGESGMNDILYKNMYSEKIP